MADSIAVSLFKNSIRRQRPNNYSDSVRRGALSNIWLILHILQIFRCWHSNMLCHVRLVILLHLMGSVNLEIMRNFQNQKDEFDDDVMIEGSCTLTEDNSWLLKPWAKKAKPLPNIEF